MGKADALPLQNGKAIFACCQAGFINRQICISIPTLRQGAATFPKYTFNEP